MPTMHRFLAAAPVGIVALVALALLITPAPGAAQDPISAAKDLYASAAYDEALVALRTAKERGGPDIVRQAEEYIAFCLVALGRQREAEIAAESAIRLNPLAELDSSASPRIEAMFMQVRKRLLPGLIRDRYRGARDMMNQGASSLGLEQLKEVRLMLDSAKEIGSWDETLGDLSVLVDGFLELNRAATAERTPPPAAAPVAPVAESANVAPPVASRPAPAAAPVPSASSLSPATYRGGDADVIAPAVVRQDIPELTLDSPTKATKRSGVLEVTIDEHGNVLDAVMRESISGAIDAQLIKAARSWKYVPATRLGTPVRYIKIVGISLGR